MAIKRPKPEEIVVKLRRVEVLIGQGMPRIDAIRQIGVTEQTYSSDAHSLPSAYHSENVRFTWFATRRMSERPRCDQSPVRARLYSLQRMTAASRGCVKTLTGRRNIPKTPFMCILSRF